MAGQHRPQIPRPTQVEVFFRDRWLCTWCGRPVVFPLAFKLLSEQLEQEFPHLPLALWNQNWRRDQAPLLDELGACVDHVEAFAHGGSSDKDNLATACARCNARKSDQSADEYLRKNPPWKVQGTHGEPEHWDGLASMFVKLAHESTRELTRAEREWLQSLEAYHHP